jgi:hypothetical protein
MLLYLIISSLQSYDHFSKERVCPGEPLASDLCWVIHRKRLVHQIVFGRRQQALQTVGDLFL